MKWRARRRAKYRGKKKTPLKIIEQGKPFSGITFDDVDREEYRVR